MSSMSSPQQALGQAAPSISSFGCGEAREALGPCFEGRAAMAKSPPTLMRAGTCKAGG